MSILEAVGLAFIRKCYLLSICSIIICSCKTVNLRHYDNEKIYNRQSTSLKLDGYYSYTYDSLFYPMFLYEDGTALNLGGFSNEKELTKYLKNDLTGDKLKNYLRVDSGWGGFYTNDNEIVIQTVVSLSSGGIPVSIGVLEHIGAIVDNSSFRIRERVIPQRDQTRSVDVLYRFHSYSPKPDSANWVKEKVKEKSS